MITGPLKAMVHRLRGKELSGGSDDSKRAYHCNICGVDGHSSRVCMFASDAERSASQRAQRAVNGLLTQTATAELYGVTSGTVSNARLCADTARIATLRALTQMLIDDMGFIDAVRGRERIP
jgi:hypothetical protein